MKTFVTFCYSNAQMSVLCVFEWHGIVSIDIPFFLTWHHFFDHKHKYKTIEKYTKPEINYERKRNVEKKCIENDPHSATVVTRIKTHFSYDQQ